MGLVDYSESSDSEPEAPAKPVPKPSAQAKGKKPFQKVVDSTGKIRVNLAQVPEQPPASSDEPPAKRARTGGGGLFGGFNSFLPAPKNTGSLAGKKSSGGNASRPGVSFKTSAEPGFSREGGYGEDAGGGGGMGLPPPKAPQIPADQTPAEEVKLVGKPLMFKPLSVARKPVKKNKSTAATKTATQASAAQSQAAAAAAAAATIEQAPAPKRVSLFGISASTSDDTPDPTPSTGTYEPLFASSDPDPDLLPTLPSAPQAQAADPTSLDTIADDLSLTPAARRELFGRGRSGASFSASRVVNFNTDAEYAHNEEIRASGEQQTHNPVRAIQPGKHSLRQLINTAQNQKEALEESFIKGRTNQREAAGRYGW